MRKLSLAMLLVFAMSFPVHGHLGYYATGGSGGGGGDMLAATYDPFAIATEVAFASTSIVAGIGLDGGGVLKGPIITLDLADTTVTPGSYTVPSITVNAQGQLTAAASGVGFLMPASTDLGQIFVADAIGGGAWEPVTDLAFDSATNKLSITSTAGPQVTLKYDALNETTYETDSIGEGHITPTGGIINIDAGPVTSGLHFHTDQSFGRDYLFENTGSAMTVKGAGTFEFMSPLGVTNWAISLGSIVTRHGVRGTLLVSPAQASPVSIPSVAEFEGEIDQLVLSWGSAGGGSLLKVVQSVDNTGDFDITPSGGDVGIIGTLDAQTTQISSVITPPVFSATQNDFQPTGYQTATIWKIGTDDGIPRSLTGITAIPGRVIYLVHATGSGSISLQHENAGSLPVNRFILSAATLVMPSNGCIQIWYDSAASRWRVLSTY